MSTVEMVTTGVQFAAAADQEVFPFRTVTMHNGAPRHATFSDHFVIGRIIIEPDMLSEIAHEVAALAQQVTTERLEDNSWKPREASLPPRLESFIEGCSTLIRDYVLEHCPTIPGVVRETVTVGPYEYNPEEGWRRDTGNNPNITTFRSVLLGAPMVLAEGWFKKRDFRDNQVTRDVRDTICPGRGWIIASSGLATVHRSPISEHGGEPRLTTSLEVQHAPITTRFQ